LCGPLSSHRGQTPPQHEAEDGSDVLCIWELVLVNPAEVLGNPAMAMVPGKQPGERRDQERWDGGRR